MKLIANSYWMPIDVPIVSDVKYFHQSKHTVTLMLKVKGQVVVMKTDLMLVADQTLLHGSFHLIITTPCQVGGYFHFIMRQYEIMDIIANNPSLVISG